MHELSIVMSILESVEEEIVRRGWEPPSAVYIRVGALSGVVPEALASAYELAANETPFAGSRLVIERVPALIYCAACACRREIDLPSWWLSCPQCNAPASELVSGRELEISALEVPT